MSLKRTIRPFRTMKPVFLVFCEGETEEAYINFLRQSYRLPIKVIPHVTGLSITPALIKRYIRSERIGDNDTITCFLMYDLDTESIADKLAACKGVINISSSPCIELWFLLHQKEQTASISASDCISLMKKSEEEWITYEKGSLSWKQKKFLWENRLFACVNAKKLPEGKNPSSAVYRLINSMEDVSRENNQGK